MYNIMEMVDLPPVIGNSYAKTLFFDKNYEVRPETIDFNRKEWFLRLSPLILLCEHQRKVVSACVCSVRNTSKYIVLMNFLVYNVVK